MVDIVTRQKDAYGYFISKGLSPAVSAGIVGNLIVESNIDPCSNANPREDAIGIAQWHSDRRSAMPQCFTGDCHSQAALDCQLNLIWLELQGSHSNALAAMRNVSSASQAAQIFANLFEVCGDCHMSNRTGIAEAILKYAQSGNWGKYAGSDVQDAGVLPVTTDNPVSAAASVLSTALEPFKVLTQLASFFTKKSTWLRIGYFIMGVILLLLGMFFIFGETTSKAVESNPELATAAVAAAA